MNHIVARVRRLEQAEIHFDGGLHGYWRSVPGAGLESPLLDSGDGIFIQSEAETFDDPDILGKTVRGDFNRKHNCPFILGDARFFGIFRFRFLKNFGRHGPLAVVASPVPFEFRTRDRT